ncbi:MAG: PssE/Cps14G family polysaccharide biosynthesis glycosyltransferase [archaeon]
MIFVTVGTGKFDSIIKEIDRISPTLKEKIIAQIGNGKYVPKNFKYFRFNQSLDEYYKKSKLIISHGGAGTIYELLKMKKKVIAIANLDRTDSHQEEILNALSQENNLIWCKNVREIEGIIKKSNSIHLKKYKKPQCMIHHKIKEFLG